MLKIIQSKLLTKFNRLKFKFSSSQNSPLEIQDKESLLNETSNDLLNFPINSFETPLKNIKKAVSKPEIDYSEIKSKMTELIIQTGKFLSENIKRSNINWTEKLDDFAISFKDLPEELNIFDETSFFQSFEIFLKNYLLFLKKHDIFAENPCRFSLFILGKYLNSNTFDAKSQTSILFVDIFDTHLKNNHFFDFLSFLTLSSKFNSKKPQYALVSEIFKMYKLNDVFSSILEGFDTKFWFDVNEIDRQAFEEIPNHKSLESITYFQHHFIDLTKSNLNLGGLTFLFKNCFEKEHFYTLRDKLSCLLNFLNYPRHLSNIGSSNYDIHSVNAFLRNNIDSLLTTILPIIQRSLILIYLFVKSRVRSNLLARKDLEERALTSCYQKTVFLFDSEKSPSYMQFYLHIQTLLLIESSVGYFMGGEKNPVKQRLNQTLVKFTGFHKQNPPNTDQEIELIIKIVILQFEFVSKIGVYIRPIQNQITPFISILQKYHMNQSETVTKQIINSIYDLNEKFQLENLKVQNWEELIAVCCKNTIEQFPNLEKPIFSKLGIIYQFGGEHKNSNLNREFIQKFAFADNLEDVFSSFAFWNTFMVQNSESKIMQEASNLKRLQLSIDSKQLVNDYLEQLNDDFANFSMIITKLDSLYQQSRYGYLCSDKRLIYRLKSTKRYVERIIYEFGNIVFEDQSGKYIGFLSNNLEIILRLAKLASSVSANYNLHSSKNMMTQIYQAFQSNKENIRPKQFDIMTSIFMEHNIHSSLLPMMEELSIFYINKVLQTISSDTVKKQKVFFNPYLLTKCLKFTIRDFDYLPFLRTIVDFYLKLDSKNNIDIYFYCLRVFCYLIELNEPLITSILEKSNFDFTILNKDKLGVIVKAKFIKTSYLFALCVKANHPKLTDKVQNIINNCAKELSENEEIKNFNESVVSMESNSQLQTEILLARMGIEFEKEKFMFFTKVDFFIKPKIILEIVGDVHFFNSTIDNYSKIKKKIFVSEGYRALYVTDSFLKNFENKNKLIESIQKIRDSQKEELEKEKLIKDSSKKI